MILSKLQLNESTELEFSLDVYGTPEKATKVRFVVEGDGFDLSIPCNIDGNSVKVIIPKLKGILESKEYAVRLECVIDDRLFTPLSESVEFMPLVELDVKKTKVEPVKEEVKVAVKTTIVSEDKKAAEKTTLESTLRTILQNGFDVSKVGSQMVVKSGSKYVGLVSESGKWVKSKKECDTLTEMLESMRVV